MTLLCRRKIKCLAIRELIVCYKNSHKSSFKPEENYKMASLREENLMGLTVTDKQYPIHSYIEKYYNKTFESFKDRKNLTIVEIGVHQGESLELWHKFFSDANVIGIDRSPVNYTPSSKNITVIQGKSSRLDTFKTIKNVDYNTTDTK